MVRDRGLSDLVADTFGDKYNPSQLASMRVIHPHPRYQKTGQMSGSGAITGGAYGLLHFCDNRSKFNPKGVGFDSIFVLFWPCGAAD